MIVNRYHYEEKLACTNNLLQIFASGETSVILKWANFSTFINLFIGPTSAKGSTVAAGTIWHFQ